MRLHRICHRLPACDYSFVRGLSHLGITQSLLQRDYGPFWRLSPLDAASQFTSQGMPQRHDIEALT